MTNKLIEIFDNLSVENLKKMLIYGLKSEKLINSQLTEEVYEKQKILLMNTLKKYRVNKFNFIFYGCYEEGRVTSFNGGYYDEGVFYYLVSFNVSPNVKILDLLEKVTDEALIRFGNIKAIITVNKQSRYHAMIKGLKAVSNRKTQFGLEIETTLEKCKKMILEVKRIGRLIKSR